MKNKNMNHFSGRLSRFGALALECGNFEQLEPPLFGPFFDLFAPSSYISLCMENLSA